ncbi:peptidoglycan-binding protein [Rhizobium lemnae]|uniref:Peptidoglycan-binding protein n=1 Tax=Rhizobium lemnae TaxID=1214924 RepID=A0ABV8E2X2_9HYPH|nr:peptidoglycan-binding domain-containing protein [Rhizobium lemnae]MCJ8507543.1 peptidoglycan-binding protein [Rhizobium lemnae]
MTARKRKAPDRRKAPVKQPGLLVQALTALSRALTRHPRRVAGLLSVCVASSFVAANALWYQPEGHPAPFFRTRDATDPSGIAGYRPLSRPHDSDVTTIRIQRATDEDLRQIIRAEAPAPAKQSAPAQAAQAPAIQAPTTQPVAQPMSIAAAIHAAEPQASAQNAQANGSPNVGHPVPEQPVGSIKGPIAVPVQRPSGSLKGEDPVAAAIRTAERGAPAAQAMPRPPTDIPAASKAAKPDQAPLKPQPVSATPRVPAANGLPPATVQSPAKQAASAQSLPGQSQVGQMPASLPAGENANLIMQIQRGLLNIAYTDVTVDGVAGAQTKAAIRHFQKHYRLPENGEPSELVLRKLKSIGAL